MSILDKMKKVKKEMVDVPEHHLAGMEFDVKFIYLVGLTMAMGVDEQVKDSEKQQLEYLIKAMLMPETTFEKLLEIGNDINEEQVKQLVNTLKDYNLEYSFIIDTAMMINIDNEYQAEEREFQQIIVEMLGISKAQQDFLSTFISALGRSDIDRLWELMGNTCGIDKKYLSPYLQNAGLMVNVMVSNEIKVIKSKNLKLSGDILVEEGTTLVFDSCQLNLVGCKLSSGGKLEIRNCTVNIDANSRLQLKDIDFSNSSFKPTEKTGYQIPGVAFNISGAETVIISNCSFHGFRNERLFECKKVQGTILVDNCSFKGNGFCLDTCDSSCAIDVQNSVFENSSRGIICCLRTRPIRIEGCHFKNLSSIAIFNKSANSVSFYMKDCTFINCRPENCIKEKGVNCQYS